MIKHQALRKIDKRIYLVFIVLIGITILNAVISTYTIQRSQTITSDIAYNTNPSLSALGRMNLLVNRSRMLITNWVYLPHGTQSREALERLNAAEYILLRGKLQGLMKHWPDSSDANSMQRIFVAYEEIASQEARIMNLLHDFDDFRDPQLRFQAEDILESEINPKAEQLDKQLERITNNQTKHALKKQDAMLYRFNSLMVLILGFAVLIICSVLFATLILSRSIIVPVLTVRDIILRMGRGELPEMRMKVPDNAVGEMSQALGFMISGFRQTARFVDEIGKGNFNHPYEPLSDIDVQGHALINMRERLRLAAEEDAKRMWIANGLAQLNETMRSSNEDFSLLLNRIVDIIVGQLKVQQAAIFLLNNDDLNDLHIQLGAYYALNKRILNSKRYELKEGLVGQSVASNKVILMENQYDPYFTIDTGIGEAKVCNIMIVPLATSGKVVGAIEIASTNKLLPEQKELLEKIAEPIAASLFSVRANLITSQLLEESRKQADELASQEQELRKINNELTLQSDKLRVSEEELKVQQQELRKMNIQLRDKARLLEEQNFALEETRLSLSFKASQLEESNKYKSAFLANMSHELRTPLNSILILARLLADNKNNHLTQREIEHAQVIHKSGTDLLNLINDILDLSKIEAGKLELVKETFSLNKFTEDIHLLFREVAADRNISFECNQSEEDIIVFNDPVRLAQVIKNLLSNAFKFTPEEGKVKLQFSYAGDENVYQNKSLLQSEKVISIEISDTGIGIPEDKQKLIFEAFQQADGSTSRKFGGTGLGLSITRELVSMMGGEIVLSSKENKGSTFTVYLPGEMPLFSGLPNETLVNVSREELQQNVIHDDRNNLSESERCVLIIEDDPVFARMLMNQCHRYDTKAVIALEGEQGFLYAMKYKPQCIILDLRLPVMDGWSVLKKLKEHTECMHIPVHILSAVDKMTLGLEMGADSYIQKPIDQHSLDLLFNRILNGSMAKRILYKGENDIELQKLTAAANRIDENIRIEMLEEDTAINSDSVECILIGSQMTTEQIVQIKISADELNIPLVYVNNQPDECLVQVLNKPIPQPPSSTDECTPVSIELFKGKKVLLADDDMRNIYSLTNILEDQGMEVISAFDGVEALARMDEHQDIDIVLMDIMMPNMNGLEAIKAIRSMPNKDKLPVIAVTANAMQGDRETCLNAGASDYLTKPVNVEQLLNLMQIWLHK